MIRHRVHHYKRQWIAILLLPILLLNACSNATPTPTPTLPSVITNQDKPPLSQIGFTVQLPAALAKDQKLSIEVLDEVTGLALNSQKFEMQSIDATHYNAILSIPVGSVIEISLRPRRDRHRHRVHFPGETGPVPYFHRHQPGSGTGCDQRLDRPTFQGRQRAHPGPRLECHKQFALSCQPGDRRRPANSHLVGRHLLVGRAPPRNT